MRQLCAEPFRMNKDKDENSLDAPLANGTNGREACPTRWIAVLVQVNCERRVAARLGKLGYETYVPTQEEVHLWSDRKKKIDRLVMPMVVFVRIAENEEKWLRHQSYVYRLLSLPGTDADKRGLATPIPDGQIEKLRFMLGNADDEVVLVSDLKVGDAVRVASGPLRGLEGVVGEADGRGTVVGVLIDGLGYACIKIAAKHLIGR